MRTLTCSHSTRASHLLTPANGLTYITHTATHLRGHTLTLTQTRAGTHQHAHSDPRPHAPTSPHRTRTQTRAPHLHALIQTLAQRTHCHERYIPTQSSPPKPCTPHTQVNTSIDRHTLVGTHTYLDTLHTLHTTVTRALTHTDTQPHTVHTLTPSFTLTSSGTLTLTHTHPNTLDTHVQHPPLPELNANHPHIGTADSQPS